MRAIKTGRGEREEWGKEYKKGQLKLTAVWGTVWEANTAEASYNIYMREDDLGDIAKNGRQSPNWTSPITKWSFQYWE